MEPGFMVIGLGIFAIALCSTLAIAMAQQAPKQPLNALATFSAFLELWLPCFSFLLTRYNVFKYSISARLSESDRSVPK